MILYRILVFLPPQQEAHGSKKTSVFNFVTASPNGMLHYH